MKKSARKFQRPKASKPYRKVFYVFTEGCETEPRYFNMLDEYPNVIISVKYDRHKTHPVQVLKRAKKFIKDEKLRKECEVWLVVDVDNRNKSELQNLYDWAKEEKNYCLAISNPCFEYWLLLHFDKGDDIENSEDCLKRLKEHLPNYRKSNLDRYEEKLKANIEIATSNAKKKHKQCEGEYFTRNYTTVYRLVENIINANKRSFK